MSEQHVFSGERNVDLEEEEVHVGIYGSMYHLATAEPVSGETYFNKITAKRNIFNNPNWVISYCGKRSTALPNSVEGFMRKVYMHLAELDLDLPRDKLRGLYETLEHEHRGEHESAEAVVEAGTMSKEFLAMAAEDGVYAEFYGSDNTPVRDWIEGVSQSVYSILSTHKIYTPEDDVVLAKNIFATETILHRINGLLQVSLGMDNPEFHGARFSLVGVGLNDIAYSISMRVLQLVAKDSNEPDAFPSDSFSRRITKYARTVGELRPRYINAESPTQESFKSLVHTNPAGCVTSVQDSMQTIKKERYLALIAERLGLDESLQNSEVAFDTFHPSGYAGIVRPCSSGEGYTHYYADGHRVCSYIGVSDVSSPHSKFCTALAPIEKPAFLADKVHGVNIEKSHLYLSGHRALCPREESDADKTILAANRALNNELFEKAVEYPELFELLHEVGPALFVDHPDCSILFIYCPDEEGLFDVMALVDAKETLEGSECARIITDAHVGFESSNGQPGGWYGILLSRPEVEMVDQSDAEDLNVDTIDDVKLEPARWRSIIRSEYANMSILQFQNCLVSVSGIANVEEDFSKGKGSHSRIRIRMSDGSKRTTTSCETFRTDSLHWTTVWKLLQDLDISVEDFSGGVDAAGDLKKKGRGTRREN